MHLYPKINPLIWWLIAIFLISPLASAAIDLKADITCVGGSGSMESDTSKGRTYVDFKGNASMGQTIRLCDTNYTSFTGLDASKGSASIRTPEYTVRQSGTDLLLEANLGYSTTSTLETILEPMENLKIDRTTTKRFSDVSIKASGNGSLSEEIILLEGMRPRKLIDNSLFGNYSLSREMHLSGVDVRDEFGAIVEPEEEE